MNGLAKAGYGLASWVSPNMNTQRCFATLPGAMMDQETPLSDVKKKKLLSAGVQTLIFAMNHRKTKRWMWTKLPAIYRR